MSRLAILIPLFALTAARAGVEKEGNFDQQGLRIAGSTWISDDGPLGAVTYYFEPGGTLVYTYPNGSEYRNGTWKIEGTRLYFEANQAYREFRAPIRADKIVGPSWNKAGNHWTTTLVPKRR
jgi:hypothetical protein